MADIAQALVTGGTALVSAAAGAGLTYWLGALNRRHQEEREDATRWYEARLNSYVALTQAVSRIAMLVAKSATAEIPISHPTSTSTGVSEPGGGGGSPGSGPVNFETVSTNANIDRVMAATTKAGGWSAIHSNLLVGRRRWRIRSSIRFNAPSVVLSASVASSVAVSLDRVTVTLGWVATIVSSSIVLEDISSRSVAQWLQNRQLGCERRQQLLSASRIFPVCHLGIHVQSRS
jgi:hypothetical protein